MPQRKTLLKQLLIIPVLLVVVVGLLMAKQVQVSRAADASPVALVAAEDNPAQQGDDEVSHSTADHTKFEVLQQPFETVQDVTNACLSCHTEAADQVMHTIHWTWEKHVPDTDQTLGKKDIINNFCISIQSNEPRCTSCHAGYGWKDKTFDFTVQQNVDCLVCHDTTGTYKKFPTAAGLPVYEPTEFNGKMFNPPDLNEVAQNVGHSSRNNCGACHFYGGGGDGVKHGDLDSSLKVPDKSLDVHMSPDGANFQCSDCHTANSHEIAGSRLRMLSQSDTHYDLPNDDHNRATCESCHGITPHSNPKINDHTDKVACQTCHIPEYARGGVPTKMEWYWKDAGQFNDDGSIKSTVDEQGFPNYNTLKGSFVDEVNVKPEYYWFNGVIRYTLATDKIDDTKPVEINPIDGSYDDPNARIYPFKVHRGNQPYDPVNKTLVIPHLFGKDDTAYWKNFDWGKSIQAGMDYAGLPYSGQYDFVDTEMYWPITHMVAPKEDALACDSCHTDKTQSRVGSLEGFYMPARDHNNILDLLGWLAAAGSLLGVVVHSSLRIFGSKKGR